MIFILLSLIAFCVLFIFLFLYFERNKHENIRKNIELSWGLQKHKERNFSLIQKFSEYYKNSISYSLSKQTSIDIEIETLFSYIDRTESSIGQQYLFNSLINPSLSKMTVNQRQKLLEYFVKEKAKRESTSFILNLFEKKGSSLIVDIFDPNLNIYNGRFNNYFIFQTILALLTLLFSFFYLPIILFGILLFGLNLMTHIVLRHHNSYKLKVIRQVFQLIKNVELLSKLDLPVENNSIIDSILKFKRFRRIYYFLDFGIPLNDISSIIFYLLDLIKSYFLFEVHFLNFSFNQILKNKESLLKLYVYIGEIELALSTASVNCDDSVVTCSPTFIDGQKSLIFSQLTHPLIEKCVPYSFNLKNLFITGSNMSGKSTFLRSILINSILAQSIGLCFAKHFETSFFHVSSSIKVSDNLSENTSYYFNEVKNINSMICQAQLGYRNIFFIDEIFKGTNTIERIALSKAVLDYLVSSNSIVIASSHDVEIIKYLEKSFEFVHFTEYVENGELFFDHSIKNGPLKTRNAIKIIENEGFPSEIILNARLVVKKIDSSLS